ncbi:hypothetical protein C8A00DRAFT_44936 [Chaetomidium leptoderma]|uniref:Uncharacterized protein n=1 Tax=Chaetomidium leptoderma TaxID=669021 RepID=A0AAN6ZV01_9PEZI|nr:hypothetical protein C8A00DRAFT_44936 [Chaetomidium leptoderma]
MFLHSGASLHGHEYSSRPSSTIQSPAHLRGPLLRSAFSPPKQRVRAATDGASATAPRQRPVSDYIPRDPSPIVRFREPQDDPPPTPAHDESISESELSDVTLSIDGAVYAPPARRRRPRRAQRKSTTYYLGYPAPRIIGKTKVVQKVFLPRLLLQLQKCSEEGRSKPVLEVFPASRIAGPVVAPRLAKRFPGIFGVKRHLGYDDIVLVRRDDGDLSCDGTDMENEESLEKRNLLAVYSPLKHSEEAEIVLDDGSVWLARPRPNGSYDFVHTDADGNTTTARWARRLVAAATPTSLTTDTSISSTASAQTRYTFSIINPTTRRHPVMATLTPSALDVQDTYTSVSSSHARHPPITRVGRSQSVTSYGYLAQTVPYSPSQLSSSGSTSDGENDSAVCIPASPDYEATQRTVHQIDDATKMLIAVTGLWVCLRSGWSQSYNSCCRTNQDTATTTTSSPAATTTSQRGRSRRNTWTTRSSTSDTPRSTDLCDWESPPRNSGNGGAVFKRNSMPAQPLAENGSSSSVNKLATTTTTTTTTTGPNTPVISRTSTPTSIISAAGGDGVKPLPRRATSTGAAFMQRRLMVSSSSCAASFVGEEGEKDTPEAGFGNKRAQVVPSVNVPASSPPPAKAEEVGQVGVVVVRPGPEVVVEREQGPKKRLVAEEEGGCRLPVGGGAKRSGMRSRLSRWIHRFGSSSSSSSSPPSR